MKTDCHCHHNIGLTLQTISHPCFKQTQNPTSKNQIEELNKKYASLMENQLAKLSQAKQQQIDELNQIISQLKMSITKLQVRNGLDRNCEKQLREKISWQDDRIRNLENQIFQMQSSFANKKQVIKQVVKEVIVKVPVDTGVSKQEIDQIYTQNAQLKASLHAKQIEYQQRQNRLIRDMNADRSRLQKYQQEIVNLQSVINSRNTEIQKLKRDNRQLQGRVQILAKPHNRQFDPVIIRKTDYSAPQVETVYIDRPVIQTKIVEVDKIINHFIQPSRPIITRVIQCQNQEKDQRNNYIDQQVHRQQQFEYDNIANKYDDVIRSYQNERQDLVKKIKERDHDYHLLTKQIQLCKKINNNGANRGSNNSCIDVDVTILKNQQEVKVDSDGKGNQKGASKYGKSTVSNIKKPTRGPK